MLYYKHAYLFDKSLEIINLWIIAIKDSRKHRRFTFINFLELRKNFLYVKEYAKKNKCLKLIFLTWGKSKKYL